MRLIAPRSTALNQTLEKSPSVTSPTTAAPGAMYTESPSLGFPLRMFSKGGVEGGAPERAGLFLNVALPMFFTAANDAGDLNFIQIQRTLYQSLYLCKSRRRTARSPPA